MSTKRIYLCPKRPLPHASWRVTEATKRLLWAGVKAENKTRSEGLKTACKGSGYMRQKESAKCKDKLPNMQKWSKYPKSGQNPDGNGYYAK